MVVVINLSPWVSWNWGDARQFWFNGTHLGQGKHEGWMHDYLFLIEIWSSVINIFLVAAWNFPFSLNRFLIIGRSESKMEISEEMKRRTENAMNTIFSNSVIFHLCYSVQFIQHRYINIHSLDSTSTFEWLPETVGASLGDFYCEAGFQHTQLICLILLTFKNIVIILNSL